MKFPKEVNKQKHVFLQICRNAERKGTPLT